MYQHFKAIAEAVDILSFCITCLAVLLQICRMTPSFVWRKFRVSLVEGCNRQYRTWYRSDRRVPEGFAVYSGDDATAMALMLVGGKGNISVTANVAPKAMHELCVASMKGDIATARAINDKVFNLHTNLFIEPNPVPVKWALAEMEWSLTACVCHWSICLRNIMMW
jgi:4-hydroxy-tetrahydrodipicolinate synthase